MKSLLSSSFWKTAQLIIPLSLIIGSSTIAQAKDRNPLFCGLIRPGGSDYPVGSSRGYLMVYLKADESYDGNAWYFPQNLFAIYTIGGKLFKNVTSQLSADEEIPASGTLPAGSYMLVARSEKEGSIRLRVATTAGRRTGRDRGLRPQCTAAP